jgi:hypothetical protein
MQSKMPQENWIKSRHYEAKALIIFKMMIPGQNKHISQDSVQFVTGVSSLNFPCSAHLPTAIACFWKIGLNTRQDPSEVYMVKSTMRKEYYLWSILNVASTG